MVKFILINVMIYPLIYRWKYISLKHKDNLCEDCVCCLLRYVVRFLNFYLSFIIFYFGFQLYAA